MKIGISKFRLSFVLFIVVSLCAKVNAQNDYFKDSYGLWYTILSSNTVEITDYDYSTDIKIPDKVKYLDKEYRVVGIGEGAFQFQSGINKVTIPNTVTYIKRLAFSRCIGLKEIEIPNSVTYIGHSSFSGCQSLKKVTIPNSLDSIASGMFNGCYNIKEITIPESVKSIGESAFSNCISLTNIVIPNSVTSIGERAFYYCI